MFCLEPARGPSDLCPRLNGFYSHPDPAVCQTFYACVNGDAEEYTCSSGLWFDEYSGVCNWPEVTDRQGCKADSYGKTFSFFIINFKIISNVSIVSALQSSTSIIKL